MKINKTEVCPCCGSVYTLNLEEQAYFYGCCFDCSFWLKKICMSEDSKKRQVIVDGIHYMLSDSSIRGYCGSHFKIKFFDGRLVETDNLWHQGKIDDMFRYYLKDNAVFIQNQDPEPACVEDEIPF